MGSLGVHFALSDKDLAALRAITDDEERLGFLEEEIEERYLGGRALYAAESDKAWDAIHRALSDGHLTLDGGEYPLNHVVLAGEQLYNGEDYVMSLKTPSQVAEIAAALAAVTVEEFRRRYDAIAADEYGGELSDEDFEYTWGWLQDVRKLYKRAADKGRAVLFTVDA